MKRLILLLLAILCLCRPDSEAGDLVFNRISTSQGLSHYSALSLYEDELGTIWVATPQGLNRCHGTDISVYTHDSSDPNSLSCNRVRRVTGNGHGLVYVLTKQSFEVLDLELDRIVSCIRFQGRFHIDDIFYRDGLYAVCRGADLMFWNQEEGAFKPLSTLDPDSALRILFVDSSGVFWVSSSDALYRVDPGRGQKTQVMHGIYVHGIHQDSQGRIFAATLGNGIQIFSPDGKPLREMTVRDGLVSDFIRAIEEDDEGNLWVGTDKGLDILSASLEVRSSYVADGQSGSLNNSSIYDILKDSYGNIWIGTYFGGLNFCCPANQSYHILKSVYGTERGETGSSFVSCVTEDSHGHIWIGTVDGGLTCYDQESREYRCFRHKPAGNSISGDNIKSLYHDAKRNALWIGTHMNGFSRLDLKTMEFRNYSVPGNVKSQISNVVSSIIPYQDELILSTYRGVFLFSPENETFRKILNLSYIRTAFMDSRGGLWLGSTSDQLFLYQMEEERLQSYGKLLREQNNGNVSTIYGIAEDGDGNLWFASFGGGLKKYDARTGKFETISVENSSLPTDNLLGVCYWKDGRIILTERNGYLIYDTHGKEFYLRNRNHGIPADFVMENVLSCSNDGRTVFIGTNDGLLCFREDRLIYDLPPAPVVFSHLWINGREVKPGDGTGILDRSIMYVDGIELSHEQNSFSIGFFQPGYHHESSRTYQYCLDDGHPRWQTLLPGETMLRFYNQSPGRYRILVRSTEDEAGQALRSAFTIHIRPPFYRTVLAYVSYVLLLLAAAAILILSYIKRLKEKERMRYVEKKNRYEKALLLSKQQAKLQFFFGISHEFSTPLTIILGQLELLMMRYDFKEEIRSKLESIYMNATQLHDLIFELLEFRKHDMGQMKLKVAEYDICRIADESFQLYREYSQSRDIDFQFRKDPESILVWCDRKQMYKVFNNLLSNAFKYTDAGGHVTLDIRRMENEVCIRIEDNGCGMDQEDIDKVFSEFYQGKQAADKPGVGLGLHLVKKIISLHKGRIEVRSEPDKGTAFFIYMKLGNGHFSLEELVQDNVNVQALDCPEKNPAGALEHPEDYTLLIVEDNNALREMLAGIFRQYCKVITAVDGSDGWNKIRQNDVDIVVSDIVMPNLSGTELCERIKNDIETCHIPVVLLSVRASVQNCIEGFNVRADDYITKPFSVRLLVSRCANLLRNRDLLQKKFRQSPNADVDVLTTNVLDKEFTEKLIRLIEENMDDSGLNIAFLQEHMFVSRTTLFQKLKAITGQTPMEFIMNIRLKKAAELLMTRPDLSISAVSDMVGFGSSRYFSRVFKETYRIRPLDYRNGKRPSEDR